MSKGVPFRGVVLEQAAQATLKTRHENYGDPLENLTLTATLMALYKASAKGKYSTGHDEAIHRVFVKLARIATGQPGHTDSYVDGAAYFAIAAECEHTMGIKRVVADENRQAAASEDPYQKVFGDAGVVVEYPINRDTALPKEWQDEELKPQQEEKPAVVPRIGMLFKTQMCGHTIWEIQKIHDDGYLQVAVLNRPPGSKNPTHYMERMAPTAIRHVVVA